MIWCLSRGVEEVRENQVGIWEKNITGHEKRFNGLKAEGSMVCLRNGSGWRSKGRGPGEKPREVKVGPTGGSSRSLEAPGSHREVLLEGGVVRPVCFKITQLLY